MTFPINWTVPTDGEDSGLEISLEPGQVMTLVGPNGAGKSALISWLNSQVSVTPVNRIVAHRRIWLASSGPEVTASRREQFSGILSRHDRGPESRTSGQYEEHRVSGVLYDLIARENGRNSRFVRRVESGEPTDDIEPSLLTTISDIMKAAGFDMRFEITDHMGLDVVHKSAIYPISAMSDGEKAALLLAAEILLAPVGSIQLLDEPERHFHRSVSPKLISGLIEARPDCGFVVSTHDLDLVERINLINNSIYLVKDVNWSPQGTPAGWDIQKLPAGKPINESARRAVFGGRQEILFVEGESGSLDLQLLSILFPEYSVTPAGSSDNVQRTVSGLQSTKELHWVSAKGIIDGDARGSEEVGKLRKKNILVLPVNEIESLYYLPNVVETQARRQAEHLDEDWQNLFQDAQEKALDSIRRTGVLEHLAATNADKILRRSALASLPDKNALKASSEEISLTLQSPYSEELRLLRTAVEHKDLAEIVKRFSIRDSGFPTAVAKALRYNSKEDYQRAVTVTVHRDEALGHALRELIMDSFPAKPTM
ncbi:AAA family ATPase [Corynebacterium sanguinis]|uniref:AAA family ATPase n=1 Tax=Corynebacterium sanguinis TaxID=2594913 RepID=UPI0021AFD518|nr:AAA family ATPase [Corynebacterium sanguinis]MCT1445243.1 AAA family ATPase [Corynebacterium sanguinis]MCT1695960.1 AAA family ATPase [Corynebacterium sanguinis]MCT1715385.1 AAA family ATPase [Corynebacterium sanguinis]